MHRLLRAMLPGVLAFTICASGASASDSQADESPAHSDARTELVIKLVGGVPPMPIRDAQVSVKALDGTNLAAAKRSDTHGETHFQNLPRVKLVVVAFGDGWKTSKTPYTTKEKKEELVIKLDSFGTQPR